MRYELFGVRTAEWQGMSGVWVVTFFAGRDCRLSYLNHVYCICDINSI